MNARNIVHVMHELVSIVGMRWHLHCAQAGACTACKYSGKCLGRRSIEELEAACVLVRSVERSADRQVRLCDKTLV